MKDSRLFGEGESGEKTGVDPWSERGLTGYQTLRIRSIRVPKRFVRVLTKPRSLHRKQNRGTRFPDFLKVYLLVEKEGMSVTVSYGSKSILVVLEFEIGECDFDSFVRVSRGLS